VVRGEDALTTAGGTPALLRFHQTLEDRDIPAIVSGPINGCFGDEGSVGGAWVVQQAAESCRADFALADMLVAIEF
jgi:hypothetical protein